MIVIPMAGLSSRFTKAGYNQPKYMLPLAGKSVFYHSVSSFSAYFETTPFLFIARENCETKNFIQKETERLGIRNVQISILEQKTKGQADSVAQGLKKLNIDQDCSITVFNIDTFRPGFRFPSNPWFHNSDGYLEVFKGNGPNWSYVLPDNNSSEPLTLLTAEKKEISDLCCDGLYHFSKVSEFFFALNEEIQAPSSPELYIAPMYNHLIKKGCRVHYKLIPSNDITFCGIPSEYEALIKKMGK